MNRTAGHVVVILITGLVIAMILRDRKQKQYARQQESSATAARDVSSDVGPTIAADGWMTDFELTERSGKQVASKDLLGQPYVVSFFFTKCPSTCPMQNSKLRVLQDQFWEDDVRFLSISCDPEIDTPEVLAEYAQRYEAHAEKWLFLTGDLTYIRRVGAEVFKLPVDRRFHTDRFVLVDAKGEIKAFYEWPEPTQFDKLKADLRKMLDGQAIETEETEKTNG